MDNDAAVLNFEHAIPDSAMWPGYVTPHAGVIYIEPALAAQIPEPVRGPLIDPSVDAKGLGVVNALAHPGGPVYNNGFDTHYMPGHIQRYKKGLDNAVDGPVGHGDYGNALFNALAQQGVNGPSDVAIQAALAAAL